MDKPKITDDRQTVLFSFGAKIHASTDNAIVARKTSITVYLIQLVLIAQSESDHSLTIVHEIRAGAYPCVIQLRGFLSGKPHV